jgi:hypothetical protein
LRAILTLTFAFTNAHDDTRYTSQKSIQLYVTTGTANDWFYDTDASSTNCVGTTCYRAYGFTIELRDTGLYVAPPLFVNSDVINCNIALCYTRLPLLCECNTCCQHVRRIRFVSRVAFVFC